MIGLVQQKYQLVLGAGASVGAVTSDGNPVMAGFDLTEALIRDFGLPRPADPNLRRVYAAAQDRRSLTGGELHRYLKDLYTGCQAPDWYRYLVAIPWRYIWTLNIDDVLENAYMKLSRRRQEIGLYPSHGLRIIEFRTPMKSSQFIFTVRQVVPIAPMSLFSTSQLTSWPRPAPTDGTAYLLTHIATRPQSCSGLLCERKLTFRPFLSEVAWGPGTLLRLSS